MKQLRICVLKRNKEQYIRLRIKREPQERTPFSFMCQVAFPLKKNEVGADLRLHAPFFCPWDHFVKDLSMELLETEPGSWEVPERSLRIDPSF